MLQDPIQYQSSMGSQIVYGGSITAPPNMPESQLELVEDLCFRKIWKNKLSQTIIEQYSVFDASQTGVEAELEIYRKRKIQEFNLVKVLYVENINKEYLGSCCKELRVFTEHIPVLISDIESMSLNSALYFLKKALTGYQLLFREIGFFEITADMMGLNTENQPKVWLNTNWAINKPLERNLMISSNSIHMEGIMVRKVFEALQKVVRVQELIKYLLEKHKIQQWTFQLAHAFIAYFLQAERVMLPCKVSFIKKYSRSQHILEEQESKKVIGKLKNQKLTSSIKLLETNPEKSYSPRHKRVYPAYHKKSSLQQSVHYRYETPGILNFKPKNSQIFGIHSKKLNKKHPGKMSSITQQTKSRNLSVSEGKLKTQSTILKPQFAQFKKLRQRISKAETSEASSSKLEQSKTSETDCMVNDAIVKASTIDSNRNIGYYSPMIQPLSRPNFSEASKNWLVLSQEVKPPKSFFQQGHSKSPNTCAGSPYLRSNDIKQSQIIAQTNQQIIDPTDCPSQSFLSKPNKMAESITINEFLQPPKRSDKPLLMLDMLVSRKASERILDEQAPELYPNTQPKNNLVLSIMEPQQITQQP